MKTKKRIKLSRNRLKSDEYRNKTFIVNYCKYKYLFNKGDNFYDYFYFVTVCRLSTVLQ